MSAKISWWPAYQDVCSYYHKTHSTSPKTVPRHYEWYRGCDLNQYFEHVKDAIILKTEAAGCNDNREKVEQKMLPPAFGVNSLQGGDLLWNRPIHWKIMVRVKRKCFPLKMKLKWKWEGIIAHVYARWQVKQVSDPWEYPRQTSALWKLDLEVTKAQVTEGRKFR